MIKVNNNRSGCPECAALDIIGDQWSSIVIRDLFMERTTFSEFRNSPEKISTKILTDRLNNLLSLALFGYVKNPKNKKIKVNYLKGGGIVLYPILYELSLWIKKNLDMKFQPLSVEWYDAIKGKDPKEIITDISLKYRSFREGILYEMVA